MHENAYNFVRTAANLLGPRKAVCEFGSRDINGTIRPLFANASLYIGVDSLAGPGADVVADSADYTPDGNLRFDTVVTTEMLEHTPRGKDICANAHRILEAGGVLIITTAAPPRGSHSAIDGGKLRAGEYYGNVTESILRGWLAPFGCILIDTWSGPGDIYAIAVKTAAI